MPFSASAGVLPFFSVSAFPIFNTNIVKAEIYTTNYNSQNIELLNPAIGLGGNGFIGGGDILVIDDTALLAETGVSGTIVDIEKTSDSEKISIYEVRDGDTLSQIADMFDVTVNTIRWANDFDGSIHPGQTLIILPVTGVKHTIKHGGTIQDVADIYDADVTEIARFNGLDVDVDLSPGDEVIVPYVDPMFEEENNRVIKYAGTSSNVSSSYYSNPIPGAIITQGVHGYNAIDLGASYGTPIYASAAGKVITSKQGGWNGGYGSLIVISHPNGTQTLYSHQSSNVVYAGQQVNGGELIGYVGSTGRSTGNHLHFEVRGASNPLASCSLRSRCY